MSANTQAVRRDMSTVRYALVAALVAIAFFMSYNFAVAKSNAGLDGANGVANQGLFGTGGGGCGTGGGGCCGGEAPVAAAPSAGGACGTEGGGCCGGASSEPIEGATTVEGDIQRVFVDASRGFDPNVIRAQAGIPIEITFSEGFGCMAQVMSRDFGFFEDLTAGSKTIALPALEPGQYGFSCGMEMVFGTIVVE